MLQINLINLLVFSGIALLIAGLIIDAIVQRLKKRKIQEIAIQLAFDKTQLLSQIESMSSERDIERSEGFIKFLSQSRDWAFEYIATVQKALEEFSNKVEPTFKWNKTYGTTLGKNVHTEAIDQISEAYDKLKELLPEDNQTPNN